MQISPQKLCSIFGIFVVEWESGNRSGFCCISCHGITQKLSENWYDLFQNMVVGMICWFFWELRLSRKLWNLSWKVYGKATCFVPSGCPGKISQREIMQFISPTLWEFLPRLTASFCLDFLVTWLNVKCARKNGRQLISSMSQDKP